MTTTKDRDAAIRKKARKGGYRDPARDLGTSKKARRRKKARQHKNGSTSPDARQVSTGESDSPGEESLPVAIEDDEEDLATTVRYGPDERISIMLHALQTSVEEAAEKSSCTKDTIYRWFTEEGGIGPIREYVKSKAEVSLHETLDTFLGDLPRRLSGLDNEEYFETFRTLMESAEKAGLFGGAGMSRGKTGGGSSENSPEGTDQQGIHFHLTAPAPSSETASPTPDMPDMTSPGAPPEEEAESSNPSVFDE